MLLAFAFCNCHAYIHVDGCHKVVASKLPDSEGLLSDTLPSATIKPPSATIKAANEAACTGHAKSNQTEFRCGRIKMMFPIFRPMCPFLGPVTRQIIYCSDKLYS